MSYVQFLQTGRANALLTTQVFVAHIWPSVSLYLLADGMVCNKFFTSESLYLSCPSLTLFLRHSIVMESIKSLVEKMGNNSSASVASGGVKGAILQLKDEKPFYIAYSAESEGMVVSRHFSSFLVNWFE